MAKLLRAGAELIPGETEDHPGEISISGVLFVETDDGRTLRATGGGLGLVARAEHVTRADVEHWVNVMLGRGDPDHRPPHLAWEQLDGILEAEGIEASQQQLIALPFKFEFAPELAAMLDTGPGPDRAWSFRPSD